LGLLLTPLFFHAELFLFRFLLASTLFFCALPAFLLFLPAALILLLMAKPLLLCFLLAPLLGFLLLTILFLLLSTALLIRALPLLGAPALLFLPSCLVGVDRPDHLVDCPLAGHEAVNPMQIGEPYPETPPRLRVLDAEWDDDLVALASNGDLAADVVVPVALLGEDQQHRPAGLDRLDDLVVERFAWAHVAWCDPAGDAPPF
jgi:hypothetical protein